MADTRAEIPGDVYYPNRVIQTRVTETVRNNRILHTWFRMYTEVCVSGV